MIYNNCCHNLATSFKLLNPGSTLQRLARQLCRVHRPSQPPRSHHGPRFAGRRPSYPRLHDRQETRFSNFGIINFVWALHSWDRAENTRRCGWSIPVQLVSTFTSLDSAASLHTKDDIISSLVKASIVKL